MKKVQRDAFSLMELIFVILILGIIATISLPRFVSISDDARVVKLQAFAATLERSVGPGLWSGVLRREPIQKGSVANSTGFNTITEGEEVESIPEEFINLGLPRTISLVNCMVPSTLKPDIGEAVGTLINGKVAGTALIGQSSYALGCIDSDMSSSPRFYLYDEVNLVIVY